MHTDACTLSGKLMVTCLCSRIFRRTAMKSTFDSQIRPRTPSHACAHVWPHPVALLRTHTHTHMPGTWKARAPTLRRTPVHMSGRCRRPSALALAFRALSIHPPQRVQRVCLRRDVLSPLARLSHFRPNPAMSYEHYLLTHTAKHLALSAKSQF